MLARLEGGPGLAQQREGAADQICLDIKEMPEVDVQQLQLERGALGNYTSFNNGLQQQPEAENCRGGQQNNVVQV
jgi:hypothetical protein